MKRFRHFGIALIVSATVVAAIGASAAQAAVFETNNSSTGEAAYPSTVQANQELQTVSLGAYAWFGCASYFEAGLGEASQALGSSNLYCPSNYHLKEFNANGCGITFHTGAEISKAKFSGTMEIGGAKCTKMTVTTSSPTCSASIPAQSSLGGVTFENVSGSPDELAVSIESSGLTYVGEGGAPGCPSEEAHTNGHWSGGWTLQANGPEDEAADLTVGIKPVGIHEEGGSFSADSYPVDIAGEQSSAVQFSGTAGMPSVFCSATGFSSALTESTSSLALTPELGGCTNSLGQQVSVELNGCEYVLAGAGSLGFGCGGGSAIEFLAKNGSGATVCTTTVEAQSGLSGIGYTAVGSGDEAGIRAELEVEG